MASSAKAKTSTVMTIVFVVGMLISGTLNTLTTKIQFTMKSIGIDGTVEVFQKPWFGTLNMLTAMAAVGIVNNLIHLTSSSSATMKPDDSYALIQDGSSNGQGSGGKSDCCKRLLTAIPAAFDLLATALSCTGILYIPASVWQMLRGSSIVFSAILSILFLKRKLYVFNLIGLVLCVSGIGLVGFANYQGNQSDDASGPGNSASDLVLGMTLVLSGQVVQAAQSPRLSLHFRKAGSKMFWCLANQRCCGSQSPAEEVITAGPTLLQTQGEEQRLAAFLSACS